MRALWFTLLAICLAFVVDFVIGQVGLRFAHVPKDFPPFTLLPILSGAVAGPVLARLSYAIFQAVFKQPEKKFLFFAVAALTLSFSLPLRLSFTKSRRFAGVTLTAQMILVLMHTVVATISVVTVFESRTGK